ncbi:MAG: polysaccharide biosynthesis/export family protein [Syntrophobacteraceae bacterium]
MAGGQGAPPGLSLQPFGSQSPGPVPAVALRSGDVIEVKFAFAPQFDQTETVRPDGKIELQLVGEVVVQGKSPSQLHAELFRLYAVQLQHPQLQVLVKRFYDRQVYVGGEVKRPGPVQMQGELTVLEAVLDAGGVNPETAEADNVLVIRTVDGHMVGRTIDLAGAVRGVQTKPFYLQPRDVVYVPRTRIANMDVWVQQHLWKLLPSIGIGATLY